MAEQTAERSANNELFRLFVRLQNPLMAWLLRSPLHGLVSGKYALISVTGRKSGRQYTTPVQYGQSGNRLFVITSQDYRWWRNLRGGAPVGLVLRGLETAGWATIETNTDAVEAAARTVYPTLKDAQLARFLPQSVAVIIQLKGDH